MIITTIIGGMGNQLRAYASAYTVSKYLKQQLVLDVADYFGGYFRPYVLDRLAAISYLCKRVNKPVIYFFSDDIEWAKKALGYRENYYYINCMDGMESDIEELFLMASCKHHILTNQSTFGE